MSIVAFYTDCFRLTANDMARGLLAALGGDRLLPATGKARSSVPVIAITKPQGDPEKGRPVVVRDSRTL